MAFKVAGSLAMKQALEQAAPVLLEPIMQVTVNVPEDAVGDVIGDLNSRRGRPLGMEPVGAGMTEVKAEVPMAEMLSYAPDLRSITGGQGEFTMEFLRYEEVPGHLAGKVVDEARAEKEAVKRRPVAMALAGSSRAGLRRPFRYARRVSTKDIRTAPADADVACDVCGRTLLRGERAYPYLERGEHAPCASCAPPRARQEGWVREGTVPATTAGGAASHRRRSLLAARCAGRPDAPSRR